MPELYDFQRKAVDDLLGGKHICISPTGSGKTAMLFTWLKETGKKNVVIITTANKAKSGDMDKEAVLWNGQEWVDSLDSFTVLSWHKLDRFCNSLRITALDDYAFVFDEVQRCKGYSSGMGKAFRFVTKYANCWSGYTATPGDQWKDFVAYFVGAGLVKNITQFRNDFCIMQNFRGFPEIVRYINEDMLLAMWNQIATIPDASELFRELPPETHEVVNFEAPVAYKKVKKDRVKEDGTFIETTMELCHYLRQICFTKEKQEWLSDFIENLGTNCIFFCNYIEEEEVVCEIAKKVLPKGARIWRIDGKHHEIPTKDTIGKYDIIVAHYLSGGEALNLQFVHYWCSVSPNYSYSTSVQARGRIKRHGQTHPMFYYYLWANGTIEDDIYRCLKNKSDFSQETYAKQLDEEMNS